MMRKVVVGIDLTVVNRDLDKRRVLSAWNRKFKVMSDQKGVKTVGKFVFDEDTKLTAHPHLLSEVTFDPNVTSSADVLAHFERQRDYMKPKIKGHPKRHKYNVGNFTLRGEPVDVAEQQIIPNDTPPAPAVANQSEEVLEAT